MSVYHICIWYTLFYRKTFCLWQWPVIILVSITKHIYQTTNFEYTTNLTPGIKESTKHSIMCHNTSVKCARTHTHARKHTHIRVCANTHTHTHKQMNTFKYMQTKSGMQKSWVPGHRGNYDCTVAPNIFSAVHVSQFSPVCTTMLISSHAPTSEGHRSLHIYGTSSPSLSVLHR
jgi:hypothetical protein